MTALPIVQPAVLVVLVVFFEVSLPVTLCAHELLVFRFKPPCTGYPCKSKRHRQMSRRQLLTLDERAAVTG